MEAEAPNTSFPKKERLCGKINISRLLAEGKHGSTPGLRFLYLRDTGNDFARLMISVPKRSFKRAVKRNLLKRRIRESWRRQKSQIKTEDGLDILVMYVPKEVMSYEDIYAAVGAVIEKLNRMISRQTDEGDSEK